MEAENKRTLKEIPYELPTRWRLFSAYLFDFFSFLLLGVLLLGAAWGIMEKTPSYRTESGIRNEILLSSRLYEKSEEDGLPLSLPDYFEKEKTPRSERISSYDERMEYFFSSYVNEELGEKGEETYLHFKTEAQGQEGNALFSPTGERSYPSVDYDATYLSFYEDTYQNKALGYLSLKAGYPSSRKHLLAQKIAYGAAAFSLSWILLEVAIPLILSRGKKTLGMLFGQLALLDARGMSCSARRFLLDSLFRYFVLLWGSALAFLIPLGVSLGMMLLRKDRQSLSDYVLGVYHVSAREKEIYKSPAEYELSLKKAEDFANRREKKEGE